MENIQCNHECSRCGACCAICLPITKEEESTIREYVKEHNIKPENLREGKKFYAMCCFYDRKNHLCKIYPVRPKICRTFSCDMQKKDILANRKKISAEAFWNYYNEDTNVFKNVTTFELLFYNNPYVLVELLIQTILSEKKKDYLEKEDVDKLKNILRLFGQEELANAIEAEEM